MSSKQIRYYQSEAISAVINALRRGVKNQILCMATGTGKTFTAAKIIRALKEIGITGPTCWGTHTEELCEQSAKALIAELELMPYLEMLHLVNSHDGVIELVKNASRGGFFLDPKTKLISDQIGIIKADVFVIDKPFVVCSMQTLHNRLDRISPEHFDVFVADECHTYMSRTFRKSLEFFNTKLRLGLSGTPFRMDGMLMSDIFDEIVYDYPIDKGMADGFLCKIDAIQIRTSIDLDAVHTMAGEFNQKELTITVNTLVRNNAIANAYLEHANGRKFIAYCVDIEHAKDLCEAFVEKGIKCAVMVSDKEITSDRKGLLDEFENGDLMGLMNVGMLVTGNDFKDLGCTISTAPTKSKVKFLQGPVGRLTRLKSDEFVSKFGQVGVLIDVVDNTTKHKLINTFTLDKDLPVEKKVFISEKNRQMLLDVKFKREHSFTTAVRLQDIKVDLFQLPKVEIFENMRTKEPATQKMLDWIAKWGYDIINVAYTKKMCMDIIASQPASDKQIGFLKWKGYDVSNGVTITEADLAFKEIKAKEQAELLKSQTQEFKLPFGLS